MQSWACGCFLFQACRLKQHVGSSSVPAERRSWPSGEWQPATQRTSASGRMGIAFGACASFLAAGYYTIRILTFILLRLSTAPRPLPHLRVEPNFVATGNNSGGVSCQPDQRGHAREGQQFMKYAPGYLLHTSSSHFLNIYHNAKETSAVQLCRLPPVV